MASIIMYADKMRGEKTVVGSVTNEVWINT